MSRETSTSRMASINGWRSTRRSLAPTGRDSWRSLFRRPQRLVRAGERAGPRWVPRSAYGNDLNMSAPRRMADWHAVVIDPATRRAVLLRRALVLGMAAVVGIA